MKNPFVIKKSDVHLSCLGILVLDVFGSPINQFPDKGTSEYFTDMEIHPGGCAYNTGVDAARLGLSVNAFGKIGNDSFGDIIRKALIDESAGVKGVCRAGDCNTAFSFVMIPGDGQRRIYHTPGVNGTYCTDDINTEMIMKSSVLHIAGAGLMPALDGLPTAELLQFARKNGVLTSMDPVVRRGIRESILPCLPYLDLFLPNKDESVYITGFDNAEDQLKFYLDAGVKLAGIKLGPHGCMIGDGREILRMGIYDVPVVDTCGAGDAFIAGFLYGILQKWDMEEISKFATATATFCVGAIGATSAIAKAQKVLDFINNNELKEFDYANHQ